MADPIGKFPTVPGALLEALERQYPDRMPDASMADRELWIKAGAIYVIRHLRREFEKQNKSVIAKE